MDSALPQTVAAGPNPFSGLSVFLVFSVSCLPVSLSPSCLLCLFRLFPFACRSLSSVLIVSGSRRRGRKKRRGERPGGGICVACARTGPVLFGSFPSDRRTVWARGCAFLSSASVAWPFSGGGEAVDRETDGVSAVYPVASVSRFVFFRPPIGSLGERAEATGA